MPPGPRRRSPHFLLFSLLVWYLGHTVASASPALGGVCGNCSFTECGFSKGSCAAPQPDGRCPPSSLICACLSCTAAEQACAFGNGTCAAAEGVDGLSCPMGAHLCIGLEVFVTELDEENMIDVSTKLARRAQGQPPLRTIAPFLLLNSACAFAIGTRSRVSIHFARGLHAVLSLTMTLELSRLNFCVNLLQRSHYCVRHPCSCRLRGASLHR